jgi:hypothetical protein
LLTFSSCCECEASTIALEVLPNLAGSCVAPKVATEVVAVAFPEMLVADTVDVGKVVCPFYVNFSFVDQIP